MKLLLHGDGRPWYKQCVTGVYLTAFVLMRAVMWSTVAFVIFIIAYSITAGFRLSIVFKVIAYVILIPLCAYSLYCIHDWAVEGKGGKYGGDRDSYR